jgi:hypothetical protein
MHNTRHMKWDSCGVSNSHEFYPFILCCAQAVQYCCSIIFFLMCRDQFKGPFNYILLWWANMEFGLCKYVVKAFTPNSSTHSYTSHHCVRHWERILYVKDEQLLYSLFSMATDTSLSLFASMVCHKILV